MRPDENVLSDVIQALCLGAAKMGLTPAHTIMIGDRERVLGARAQKRFYPRCPLWLWKQGKLEEAGATYIAQEVVQLL